MNGKEIKTTCHPRGSRPQGSGISRLSPLSNQGFTLIELLVVVLIIGILAAIALPQYQKAVLKSRYTTLMPIAKGIAEGNEAYFMEHGTYAEDPTELPIKGQESYPDGTELRVVDDTDKDVSYVIATRPKLMPNNKYIVFQKHSGQFSDVTLCEATSDPLATWLCKDALKGQVVEGNSLSGTGWTGYALSGNTTGSSFALSLEQVAEGIKAQNSNYEVVSTDEESGEITFCNTSTASVVNGECIPNQGDNAMYEITYDEDGKTILAKKECMYYAGGPGCITATFYTYNDDDSYVKKELRCYDYETAHVTKEGNCSSGSSGVEESVYNGNNTLYRYCYPEDGSSQCSPYTGGSFQEGSGNSINIYCEGAYSGDLDANGACFGGGWHIGDSNCTSGQIVNWGTGASIPTCANPS